MTDGDNFNRWFPPKITDYWDWQQNALNRNAECLRATAFAFAVGSIHCE